LRVEGSGFRTQSLVFRISVQGRGCRVQSVGFTNSGSEFRVQSNGSGGCGLGSVSSGFRVQSLASRVQG